jgi:hypothetical protein
METVEKQALAARTRERNILTRLPLDYGGVMAPLGAMEADLDSIAAPGIENYMAISDEAWGIKEDQRDQTVELSQAEVDQDRLLAEEKVATGRAKIVIERAADEYVLAAKVYDAKVKGIIMGAKEFASLVEQYQLEVEVSRAGLAVDKEALNQKKVKADIYLQTIEQAQVEVDVLKAQVDVAKAHVRAAMADIEAGRAEIQLVEAQTEAYVAEADKATLQADVANIFAEILTKQLSQVKLDVGQKEIEAGFAYIQSHLDDMLALWDTREAINALQIESGADLETEVALKLLVDKVQEDLREDEVNRNREVFIHEYDKTAENLAADAGLQAQLTGAKEGVMDKRLDNSIKKDDADTQAQVDAYEAQAKVSANRDVTRISDSADFTTMTIS